MRLLKDQYKGVSTDQMLDFSNGIFMKSDHRNLINDIFTYIRFGRGFSNTFRQHFKRELDTALGKPKNSVLLTTGKSFIGWDATRNFIRDRPVSFSNMDGSLVRLSICLLVMVASLLFSDISWAYATPAITTSVSDSGVTVVVDNITNEDLLCAGPVYVYFEDKSLRVETFSKLVAPKKTRKEEFKQESPVKNVEHKIECR